jgi:putative hemolysin
MDGPGLASLAASVSTSPQLDAGAWLQIVIMVVAFVLCALASASETALTSVNRYRLKNLIEEGDQRARDIERLLSEPNTFLSTILVVNSVAVIVASSMATALALRFTANFGELLATVATSLVTLIFCEITPKTAALQNPIRAARRFVGPVMAAAWLLRPLVSALGVITAFLVRILGGRVTRRGPFVTEEELRTLVSVGEEEGVLEQEETQMINSIFEFADTAVREVMVPRIDMVTLSSDATVTEAVDLALQGGLSRIPVYEENVGLDEILGILYTKDMLKELREGHQEASVRNLVRPAYFVPETKRLDDLLREIRQSHTHMVIVVDEYGSVAGLVTIEDLVEEIVGDIQDEYDREESLYEKVNEHEYIFAAKISIDDFNELMGTKLSDSDYGTLGGFVYAQLDKIPNVGDTVTFEDFTFTVLATRGRRITKIRVERKPATEGEEGSQRELLMLPTQQERDKREHRENRQQTDSSSNNKNYGYRGA